jgi:transcriptional regulator with XRE-family HTH domain
VDPKADIQEFLTSRRARLSPAQVGLTAYGPRRVPGLRREEVAVLAGVSVPYYTRLERGNMSGVSESVLEALARALQLDDAERAHLFDLARSSGSPRPPARRHRTRQRIRPSIQRTLDAMTGAAASVRDERLDVLAENQLWRALYSEMYLGGLGPANMARFVFLNRKAPDFYADWAGTADEAVAVLHSALGRDPHDGRLAELVGELSTQSDPFRVRWAAHNVRIHGTGVRGFHHSVVGELSLSYETAELVADPGLTLLAYTAEPGSKSEESLKLLGSWAASLDQTETPNAAERHRA